MELSISRATMAGVVLWMGTAGPAGAQHTDHQPILGKVEFKVSCTPQAQKHFNLAMSYYHSYAWTYISEPID